MVNREIVSIPPDSTRIPDELALRPRRRARVRVRSLVGKAFVHFVLILLTLFALLPLAWAISSAFKTNSEILTGLNFFPKKPTLANFTFVVQNTQFMTWMRNSLQVALGTTVLALVVGSFGGYAMSRWRFRGRALYGNTLLVVQMFPGVMLAIPLFLVLTNYGLIDTLWALLVTYLTFALVTSVWMLKGYFDAIPREIEEAALIDGANRLQILWKIVLPLSGPGITTVAVFVFLLAWNEFFFAYIFLASSDNYTLSLGMYSFIQQFTTQWGNIMAAGTLTTLPVLVFFFVLQRTLTRGLVAGAMKG
jgi:ABC-type glycerol-3-phosphate transport system permease component